MKKRRSHAPDGCSITRMWLPSSPVGDMGCKLRRIISRDSSAAPAARPPCPTTPYEAKSGVLAGHVAYETKRLHETRGRPRRAAASAASRGRPGATGGAHAATDAPYANGSSLPLPSASVVRSCHLRVTRQGAPLSLHSACVELNRVHSRKVRLDRSCRYS